MYMLRCGNPGDNDLKEAEKKEVIGLIVLRESFSPSFPSRQLFRLSVFCPEDDGEGGNKKEICKHELVEDGLHSLLFG